MQFKAVFICFTAKSLYMFSGVSRTRHQDYTNCSYNHRYKSWIWRCNDKIQLKRVHGRAATSFWSWPHQEIPIKKEETTPDCPATLPRGPGTTPLSRTRFPAALSLAATPAPATTTHHVSPTAASTTGEGPVTSTNPGYWATLNFSTHCTRDHAQ